MGALWLFFLYLAVYTIFGTSSGVPDVRVVRRMQPEHLETKHLQVNRYARMKQLRRLEAAQHRQSAQARAPQPGAAAPAPGKCQCPHAPRQGHHVKVVPVLVPVPVTDRRAINAAGRRGLQRGFQVGQLFGFGGGATVVWLASDMEWWEIISSFATALVLAFWLIPFLARKGCCKGCPMLEDPSLRMGRFLF